MATCLSWPHCDWGSSSPGPVSPHLEASLGQAPHEPSCRHCGPHLRSLHSPVAYFSTRGHAQHTSWAAPSEPCGKDVVITWATLVAMEIKRTRRLGDMPHLDGHRKRNFLPRGMQLAFTGRPPPHGEQLGVFMSDRNSLARLAAPMMPNAQFKTP